MIDKHVDLIGQAVQQGAQFVCMQELFYGPYFCAEQDAKWYELTERIPDGPTVKLMQELARQHELVLVVPMYEEDLPGRDEASAAAVAAAAAAPAADEVGGAVVHAGLGGGHGLAAEGGEVAAHHRALLAAGAARGGLQMLLLLLILIKLRDAFELHRARVLGQLPLGNAPDPW